MSSEPAGRSSRPRVSQSIPRGTSRFWRKLIPWPRANRADNRSERRDDEDRHEAPHIGESIDLDGLLDGLRRARGHLDVLADLTERQLDAVPPANTMRFVDGTRTLEQILASMLKHQGHQVDAIRTALS